MQSRTNTFQIKTLLVAGLIAFPAILQANPVACFNANVGNFCMELYERQTPVTVANFRNHVDSGAYPQSFFHRSVPGFVIQGGGFTVTAGDMGVNLSAIETFDPIINEFGISNTRGTVAMAKLGGDPDSATNQWFVNLADNSANLDAQNGGFTVFAGVLFQGMTLFDDIAALPLFDFGNSVLGGALSSTPLMNFDVTQTPQVENFVVINNVTIHDVTAVFDADIVRFAVDAGDNGLFDVRLQLVASATGIVFELDLENITPLSSLPENRAVFSAQTGMLTIPSVIIDETTIVNNVVLSLTDPTTFQFTLVSFE